MLHDGNELSIEFDYDTIDNYQLIVEGSVAGSKVYFKCYENGKPFSKTRLSSIDTKNIKDFIMENADEFLTESDFYDRQSE